MSRNKWIYINILVYCRTYSDPDFCEVSPGGYLLSRRHVWISVPLECRFQLLQLLAGKVCPLATLTFTTFPAFLPVTWTIVDDIRFRFTDRRLLTGS